MNAALQQTTFERPTFTVGPEPAGKKHRFHAMVKPVGSACNLGCTYCYYLHKGELLDQPAVPRMTEDLLEEHIRQYIEAQTGEEVVFTWQGGEPTLLGIDFFRRVVELQARYKKPFQRVENDLQTNGTLLDKEWSAFLKHHGFLVGLSLDGPRQLHDRFRVHRDGRSTHDQVMAAARLLRMHEVPFNVLCVVHRENVTKPLDVYRFLTRELGTRLVQFIPCVEPRDFRQAAPQLGGHADSPMVGSLRCRPDHPDSIVTEWSVDADEFGVFLCRLWDEWYRRDYGKVHVDIFETAVAQSLGMPAQRCVNAEFCGKGLAVEHNGDVFACDHFVYPEYKVGNLAEQHLGEMAYAPAQREFGYAKRTTLPRSCLRCEHLQLCGGECPKNRLLLSADGEGGLSYLCPGLKRFYSHIRRDLPEIVRRARAAGWG